MPCIFAIYECHSHHIEVYNQECILELFFSLSVPHVRCSLPLWVLLAKVRSSPKIWSTCDNRFPRDTSKPPGAKHKVVNKIAVEIYQHFYGSIDFTRNLFDHIFFGSNIFLVARTVTHSRTYLVCVNVSCYLIFHLCVFQVKDVSFQ